MDDYESVLFVARECYVYRKATAPRTGKPGRSFCRMQYSDMLLVHRGDMGQPLWKGRIRVLEKGSDIPSKCFVRLEDANSGELFALTPYTPSKANTNGGVEAVLDSSRYFVLTVVDQDSGARAYLGMGFPERTESFDFNVALQDWSKRQTPPKALPSGPSAPSPHLPATGSRDFSLKPGETLNIKLGGGSTTKKAAPKPVGANPAFGAGGFLLPPPPPAPRRA
ncbi:adaptin ear-binding coat-associated protein 1/2, partial [Phenoliferia sp. Uapishka_3]